jgi:hypothetical protein
MLALHRIAAIDGDRRAGHEIRRRARQEDRDPGMIGRRAPAPGRGAREDALVQPLDLGAAARISGVTPAALVALLKYVRRGDLKASA